MFPLAALHRHRPRHEKAKETLPIKPVCVVEITGKLRAMHRAMPGRGRVGSTTRRQQPYERPARTLTAPRTPGQGSSHRYHVPMHTPASNYNGRTRVGLDSALITRELCSTSLSLTSSRIRRLEFRTRLKFHCTDRTGPQGKTTVTVYGISVSFQLYLRKTFS